MRRWPPLLVLGALVALVPGCVYSDLNLDGKRCDAATPCPDGLICVEVPDSQTSRVGTCQFPGTAPTCQPDQARCAATGSWIETCEPDGHSWRVSQVCPGETECNQDIQDCSRACALEADCGALETCDLSTDLCRPLPACQAASCAGLCVEDVCVAQPRDSATSNSGQPELDCFLVPPASPPDAPIACTLTGRVNLFPSKNTSDQALGLTVKLLDAQPPWSEFEQVLVTPGPDGAGYYTFASVPTNARYLIEVQAGTSDTGVEVVTTLNAGIHLRADGCLAGTATAGASVMTSETHQTYTAGTIEDLDPARGLVIGRVLDCRAEARQPIGNVTVALGIPPVAPGRIYFFPDEPILIPDLSLGATSVKGYYAAAGVPATRNQVAFSARQGSSDLALGVVDFFLRPATVAIVDLPLPAELLPD